MNKPGDYTRNVDFWIRKSKRIQSDFLCRPQIIKLLGNIKGKKVLDIGCGEGYVSRILSSKGAIVSGIDSSKKMIENAKKHSSTEKYFVNDARRITNIKNKSQDVAIAVLVFNYFKTNSDWKKGLLEAKRVLKDNGELIIGLPHPIESLTYNSKWVRFKNAEKNYFKERQIHKTLYDINGNSFKVVNNHKRMETILNMMMENGFIINKIIEPQAKGKQWQDEKIMPAYLIIKCKKVKT